MKIDEYQKHLLSIDEAELFDPIFDMIIEDFRVRYECLCEALKEEINSENSYQQWVQRM